MKELYRNINRAENAFLHSLEKVNWFMKLLVHNKGSGGEAVTSTPVNYEYL